MNKFNNRGAILAGGEGTRLKPFTKYLNKHLLPIYDRFMVSFPIETLRSLGINDICIVTGEKDYTDFKRFINDGREYAVKIEYRTQTRSKGLADAVYQTRDFFGDQKVIVILGDDVFSYINLPKNSLYDDYAYSVVVPAKGVGIDPHAVAVPEFDDLGNITRIDEKPEVPKSEFMVAGFYIFPSDVFEFIKTMKPSNRGEMEITDITNWYALSGRLRAIREANFVADAGSIDSLLETSLWRRSETKRRIEGDN